MHKKDKTNKKWPFQVVGEHLTSNTQLNMIFLSRTYHERLSSLVLGRGSDNSMSKNYCRASVLWQFQFQKTKDQAIHFTTCQTENHSNRLLIQKIWSSTIKNWLFATQKSEQVLGQRKEQTTKNKRRQLGSKTNHRSFYVKIVSSSAPKSWSNNLKNDY